jgi:hypothetical protein
MGVTCPGIDAPYVWGPRHIYRVALPIQSQPLAYPLAIMIISRFVMQPQKQGETIRQYLEISNTKLKHWSQ